MLIPGESGQTMTVHGLPGTPGRRHGCASPYAAVAGLPISSVATVTFPCLIVLVPVATGLFPRTILAGVLAVVRQSGVRGVRQADVFAG